jgi:hypothetical protein
MRTAAIAVSLCCLPALMRAQLLDRIAVTVDKQVITESAILLDRRLSAFLDGVPVDFSGTAKRQSAERMVDQLLILREAAESRLQLPTGQNAAVLLNQVKQQRGTEPAYAASLKEYGITEAELSAHLLSGLIAYTFSDLRFRPTIQISDEDLAAYLAEMSDGALIEAPRADVEELMLRQRTEDALDMWLKSARAAARIQYREAVFQ